MQYFAGLAVSLKEVSICVIDEAGAVVVRGVLVTPRAAEGGGAISLASRPARLPGGSQDRGSSAGSRYSMPQGPVPCSWITVSSEV